MKNSKIIAHVRESDKEIQLLEEHLFNVAKLTSNFAGKFGLAKIGELIGLLHDFGKYNSNFQTKITYETGLNLSQKPPNKSETQHAITGAIYFCYKLLQDKLKNINEEIYKENIKHFKKLIIPFIIAGHHTGLADWIGDPPVNSQLEAKLNENFELLLKTFENKEFINNEVFDFKFSLEKSFQDISLLTRMLFSCLIDADRLDTEEFSSIQKFQLRQNNYSFPLLLEEFNKYVNNFSKEGDLNKQRAEILKNCKEKAKEKSGIFTLTVPTGGGKTLSSLAFALEHAIQHKKNRIIYVIPYTSIIEQNADVFKKALGKYKNVVLEHHCNFDSLEKEEGNSNYEDEFGEYNELSLATENWDYPLIVTTTVQFFESLFANKTNKCRKLHNIANSIIIFDEVQLFPPDYLNPILEYIEELEKNYNITFVLCTATQPAFDKEVKTNSYYFKGLSQCNITEIIDDKEKLYNKLKTRIELLLPEELQEESENWEKIANEILNNKQALCIVNTKKSARDLFRLTQEHKNKEEIFHLSTNLCAEHRTDKILQIKNRLKNNLPCTVISTQLIEAGVDLDFPIVYRASTGLDSIAQAGGRCNRENKLINAGKLIVFKAPNEKLQGHLKQTQKAGEYILNKYKENALELKIFEEYFQELFYTKDLDKHKICELNKDFKFKEVAKKFKLIEENSGQSIIVPYKNIIELIEEMQEFNYKILRKAQRYTINLRENDFYKLRNEGVISTKFHESIFYIKSNLVYDENLGLITDALYQNESLIC